MIPARNSKLVDRQSQIPKKAWVQPTLMYTGQITEIIRAGGGKFSTPGGDPGDSRKQRSQG